MCIRHQLNKKFQAKAEMKVSKYQPNWLRFNLKCFIITKQNHLSESFLNDSHIVSVIIEPIILHTKWTNTDPGTMNINN
jgi:hypothetical protein